MILLDTDQVVGYRELALLFQFYQEFEIVPFDKPAARQFDALRKQKLRIGARDLKIAATSARRMSEL